MSLCRIIDARTDDPFAILKSRQIFRDESTEKIVSQIIDDVRQRGDAALLDSARTFDAPDLKSILVTEEELAATDLPEMFRSAIGQAADRIERFHVLQLAHFTQGLEPEQGAFWLAARECRSARFAAGNGGSLRAGRQGYLSQFRVDEHDSRPGRGG